MIFCEPTKSGRHGQVQPSIKDLISSRCPLSRAYRVQIKQDYSPEFKLHTAWIKAAKQQAVQVITCSWLLLLPLRFSLVD